MLIYVKPYCPSHSELSYYSEWYGDLIYVKTYCPSHSEMSYYLEWYEDLIYFNLC